MTIRHYHASRRYASSLERHAPRAAWVLWPGVGVILTCAVLALCALARICWR